MESCKSNTLSQTTHFWSHQLAALFWRYQYQSRLRQITNEKLMNKFPLSHLALREDTNCHQSCSSQSQITGDEYCLFINLCLQSLSESSFIPIFNLPHATLRLFRICMHCWFINPLCCSFNYPCLFWCFLFWWLTRGLIWHLSQSSIRPSIYFSLIVNHARILFLNPPPKQ